FSSRRRHTRSKRDWSSDVCSSDLPVGGRLNLASYSLGKDGTIAAQIGMTDRPDEIYLSNGSDLTRLTKTNDALLSQLRLSKVERSEERRVGKECRDRLRRWCREKI